MANFASPFWRKLQAARQDCLTLREQRCRHNIEITSIDMDQLTDLLLYCQCFLKDEELVREYDDWISWGELERYSKYGINW